MIFFNQKSKKDAICILCPLCSMSMSGEYKNMLYPVQVDIGSRMNGCWMIVDIQWPLRKKVAWLYLWNKWAVFG